MIFPRAESIQTNVQRHHHLLSVSINQSLSLFIFTHRLDTQKILTVVLVSLATAIRVLLVVTQRFSPQYLRRKALCDD